LTGASLRKHSAFFLNLSGGFVVCVRGVEGGAGRSANDRERLKGPVLEDRPNFVTFVDRGDEKIKNGRSLGDGPR